MPWADKPGAEMGAYVLTDGAELDELHRFCVDNPMPRWLWHANEPPHPSRSQFDFYFERGNPIVVVRDQDGEVWFFRINSRRDHAPLWGHFRRELDELHDEWESSPYGGMTDNSREAASHATALTWALAGEVLPPFVPGGGENKNVARADAENQATLRARALQLYEAVYGPARGAG